MALEGTGEGKKTVYVLEKDKKEAEKSGEKVVVVNEAGFIGGVRVVNDDLGIIADYSFGEELSEAKEDFLQKSSLSIE